MNRYKTIRSPYRIFQTNKNIFLMIHPKNACQLGLSGYLLLPFLDQPKSDVVVFEKKISDI